MRFELMRFLLNCFSLIWANCLRDQTGTPMSKTLWVCKTTNFYTFCNIHKTKRFELLVTSFFLALLCNFNTSMYFSTHSICLVPDVIYYHSLKFWCSIETET